MNTLIHDAGQAFERAIALVRGTELHALLDFLLRCRARLEAPMQVALVGEICSSKSTLANAMLGGEEIVRTGSMEETFNVSWLKHGDAESPVEVFFKPPSYGKQTVPRNQWAAWANRQGSETLSQAVSYIEVCHDSPMLHTFQLIDTPGLNAVNGIDSRNTLDFLEHHPPDAIVLLFSKSIAGHILEVVRLFQGRLSQGISPINAVGVLAKIDDYWPEENEPLTAGARVVKRLMEREPQVRATLFRLYPLCARLALGARTLTEEDLLSLAGLTRLPPARFDTMVRSVHRFLNVKATPDLTSETRAYLLGKLTRYGVATAVAFLRQQSSASLETVKRHLLGLSGFDRFLRDVTEHFGNRAYLIKLSRLLGAIQGMVQQYVEDRKGIAIAREVGGIFTDLALGHQAFKELDLLRQYYHGDLVLSSEEELELQRITGELGLSLRERLGLGTPTTIAAMGRTAIERELYWNTRLVTAMEPEMKNFARVLKGSYREIQQQVETSHRRLLEAQTALFGEDRRETHEQ